jgi:hypothetical protein
VFIGERRAFDGADDVLVAGEVSESAGRLVEVDADDVG